MTPQMAHPRRRRSLVDLVNRALGFLAGLGIAYFAVQAVALGIRRPDYLAFLMGLLLLTFAGMALWFAFREDES